MRAGSLINLLADESAEITKPEVGMGCTLIRWTDRHAATVIEVSPSGHRITVQFDRAIRVDSNGMSDAQSYRFERDVYAPTEVYTRRKDGSYRQAGGESRCVLGGRGHYHDYSF